jgi:hypothetical protein
MATHSSLTGADLHEPKGVASAAANQVYVSDGAGSGAWTSANTLGVTGWGYYKDNAGAQAQSTTAALLTIDGLGSTTETGYLPADITDFWNTGTNKIVGTNVGDSFTMRLDLPITNLQSQVSEVQVELDIGGLATPSIVIATQVAVVSGVGRTVSVSFGYFSLSTFVANGGQLFTSTDTGTADITAPAILIQRISRAA